MDHLDLDREVRALALEVALELNAGKCAPLAPGVLEYKVAGVEIVRAHRRACWAGKAEAARGLIHMNMALCTDETRYSATLRHEWAHLLTRWLYPDAKGSHGRAWKSVAKKLGDDGERCHDYDVAAAFPEKFTKLACPCGTELLLTSRRITKMRRGTAVYRCRRCRRTIELPGAAPVAKAA